VIQATALVAFNAERIIKNSVIFSAVIKPTN